MSVAKNANQSFDMIQEKINIIQKIYTDRITELAALGKISEMQIAMKEMQDKIINVQNNTDLDPILNAVPSEPAALENLTINEIACPVVQLTQLKVVEPERQEDLPSDFQSEFVPLNLDVEEAIYEDEKEDVTSPHLTLPAVEHQPLDALVSHTSIQFNYSHPMSDLNINELVFENERQCFEKLVADQHFIEFLDKNITEYTFEEYKNVIKVSQELQRDIFKSIYDSVETCISKLKMKNTYGLFYYPDNEQLVELCPDQDNKLYIVVNKEFLNLYSDAERTFIFGRHFGHYLCNHLVMSFLSIFERSEGKLAASHILSLYEWNLYTEVTADRFGLICSDDKNAGFSFLFKNQYGLSQDLFAKNWTDCLQKWEYGSFAVEGDCRYSWLLGQSFHPARFQLLNSSFDLDLFNKNFNFLFLFANEKDNRWESWRHYFTDVESQPDLLWAQSFISHLSDKKSELHAGEKIQVVFELTLLLKVLGLSLSKETYQLALAFEIPAEYIDKIQSFA